MKQNIDLSNVVSKLETGRFILSTRKQNDSFVVVVIDIYVTRR